MRKPKQLCSSPREVALHPSENPLPQDYKPTGSASCTHPNDARLSCSFVRTRRNPDAYQVDYRIDSITKQGYVVTLFSVHYPKDR